MPTSNIAVAREYDRLLNDISSFYEEARDSWSNFCWQTSKRIVEVEQKGAVRSMYGSRLILKLSEDLTRKYGKGFSASNLRKCGAFIWQTGFSSRLENCP